MVLTLLQASKFDVESFNVRVRYLEINLDKGEINFEDRLSKGIIPFLFVNIQRIPFQFEL